MNRKDYLKEILTNEERAYLSVVIINEKRKYIRDNYKKNNEKMINIESIYDISDDSILENIVSQCEEKIISAYEFEKIISDNKLYNIVKKLDSKEKTLLFLLYKENKSVNQIALEMKINRSTVFRMKNRVLDKIMKTFLEGC